MVTLSACPVCGNTHETTDEMTRCYSEFNRKLRAKYENSRVEVADLTGSYSVSCSVCGARGPNGPTIFAGVMAAQQTGFTHDSERMRAGQPLVWFCGTCGSKRRRN